MKVTGTITKKEEVLVDVDPESLINLINAKLRARGISIPDVYQCKDGTWEKYSYTHPHNNDDIYVPYIPSEEEIFWAKFVEELKITLRG